MKVGINQNRTFHNLSRTNTSIHMHFRHKSIGQGAHEVAYKLTIKTKRLVQSKTYVGEPENNLFSLEQ
jgi:hypothetical protein